VDPEYEACGELDLLFAEDDRRIAESDAAAGRGRVLADGGPSYVLHDRDATRRLAPAASDQIVGSLECRETAQVRNPRLLRALQIACFQSGVTIREESEVVDFIVRDRRIIGVELSQERVHGGSVVLCAGAWSSRIGKRLAGILPVHPVRGQMILLKAEGPPFRPILSRGKTYLVPRRDGHVLLGSTEEPDAGYEARTTAQGIARLLEKALRLAPGLAALPVAATWAGLRPGTPDERPYVGPVPGYEGLFAAAGHFRAGLTLAPITAEAVACLMLGRAFFADLTPLRPGRTPASPHAK
jgi:glycine oxidase